MRAFVFPTAERPGCEVLHAGAWRFAILRAWVPQEDGSWAGDLEVTAADHSHFLLTAPAELVREVDEDLRRPPETGGSDR